MATGLLGLALPLPVLALGVVTGMTYGLLAVGLVLVYRTSRIVNFAHGEIGVLGAAVLGLAVLRWGWPYWPAFALALVVSAGAGSLVEVGVVRRLRNAPRLMSLVATLGFAQVLSMASMAVNGEVLVVSTFPQPAGLPHVTLGALRLTPAHLAMVFLSPLLIGALTLFLRSSRTGLALRGASADPHAARLAGVFAARMSTLSWAVAGAMSAFTAILLLPTHGFAGHGLLGPSLLLRALTAGVLARMTNLPGALAAGIGVGVVQQAVLWNYPQSGFVELVLFAVLLVALLVQSRKEGRLQDKGSWLAVQPWRPLSPRLLTVPSIRLLGRRLALAALGLALLVPVLAPNRSAVTLVSIIAFALIGLSIAVLAGLAGELSLGQFALAGVGATASYHVARTTGNYVLALVAAGVVAAAVSALIGLPALRIRGLMLAVTTLAFAIMAQTWLLQQPWMLGDGVNPGRPVLRSLALDTGKKYYFFALAVLLLGLWLARNLWSGGFGRTLRALRDNEEAARSFSVPATRRKLQAFAAAGFLAGLGGAVYAHSLTYLSAETFPPLTSIDLVAMTAIGGVAILAGPLIGALYVFGIPAFVPLDSAGLAATSFGWLVLILYVPGGVAELVRPLRDRLVGWLAARARVEPEDEPAPVAETPLSLGPVGDHPALAPAGSAPAGPIPAVSPPEVLLSAVGLTKRFGGVMAVEEVSLEVFAGETLGLIGPNGAGKTTLFELISGFTRADAGRVVLAGRDVTSLSPEARARLGLVRSFQDSSLFETMTVVDTLRLALERAEPTGFFAAAVGLRAAERAKDERAGELVSLFGLDAWRTTQVGELSSGTRRITEIASMVALAPRLLLLDEPSAGIAQRETEALAELLQGLKASLETTLVIIEHDLPLVLSLAERVVVMEAGRVIAQGLPDEVVTDPVVMAAYVGGHEGLVARSGPLAVTRSEA